MRSDDVLEREVFEHFKRQYISSAEDRAEDEIYQRMIDHKYGKGARDPMQPIDWDKVFEQNKCPECDDIISLAEKAYICGRCGLSIPIELFDKALEEHKRKVKIRQDDDQIREKMRQAGYDKRRIGLIYDAATDEALTDLEDMKRRKALESSAPIASEKTGNSIGRGIDAKK
jgi:hypothetical protein